MIQPMIMRPPCEDDYAQVSLQCIAHQCYFTYLLYSVMNYVCIEFKKKRNDIRK